MSDKPWYNDGDKVGGFAATVTLLLVVIALIALVGALIAKVIIWLLTGDWTL